jgi:hypothetical protein
VSGERQSFLTHITAEADLDADRVRLIISRSNSPEVLSLLLTRDEAWKVAQHLIRHAEQISAGSDR